MNQQRRRPSRVLGSVLDDVGIGRYHYMQCFFLGSFWLVDGCEVLLCSSILRSLQETWDLTPMLQASLVSTVFVGVLIGGLLGGHFADVAGRRLVVLITYCGIIISALASSFCTGYKGMIICRFILGLSFGGGVPPMLTLFAESSPKAGGDQLMNLSNVGWATGELYAAFLLRCYMPDLLDTTDTTWRWVVRMSVLPNALAIFPMFWFLQESPLFLFVNGRAHEAKEVVKFIAAMNGRADAVVDASVEQPGSPAIASEATPLLAGSSQSHLSMLAEPEVCVNVCIGGFFFFTANFIYFGLTYALPQVFLALNADLGPANELLVAAAACYPGYLVGAMLFLMDSHRHRLFLSFLASALLEVAMGRVDFQDMSVHTANLGLAISSLLKIASSASISVVAVFVSDVFPTACRANAVALCITGGRIGCILAPIVHEASVKHYQGLGADFTICGTICWCAALVSLFMINDSSVERELEEHEGSLSRRLSRRLSAPSVVAATTPRDTALAELADGSQT